MGTFCGSWLMSRKQGGGAHGGPGGALMVGVMVQPFVRALLMLMALLIVMLMVMLIVMLMMMGMLNSGVRLSLSDGDRECIGWVFKASQPR